MFRKITIYSIFPILVLLHSCANEMNPQIQPVPFTQVKFTDNFWKPRIEINQEVTIPHSFAMSESTGRISNFEKAAGVIDGEFEGVYPFNDSDIYKIIEGAAYTFQTQPNAELEKYVDGLIDKIASAQEKDGYLMTWRTINAAKPPSTWSGSDDRWSDIMSGHELYCMGHLYEAAVAYYQATGKRKLLDVALKNAELILREFGPGKREVPPGHQEIEIGLVKLYRVTSDSRYLDLANFFLEQRGQKKYDSSGTNIWENGKYWQDHKPVSEQDEAVGHAVRAGYMYAAMADIALLKSDNNYIKALDKLWQNVVNKKLYITGGIGAIGNGERFGENYELPNLSAYNETCAAIANVYWNYRMFLLHGDAKYIDVMERTLYNGLISGISLDGELFFYPNVLESTGHDVRHSWFRCACCPGNITRFMPSVPGYIYGTAAETVYINLFVTSNAKIKMKNKIIEIEQKTNYPWDGGIKIQLNPEKAQKFDLRIRIPGWAGNTPVEGDLYHFLYESDEEIKISINDQPVEYQIEKGYAILSHEWQRKDIIDIKIAMPVRRIVTDNMVENNRDKVALQRGPIVYCAEWPDNVNGQIRNLVLTDKGSATSYFHPELLNGVQMVTVDGYALKFDDDNVLHKNEQSIKLIPYYAWAHRGRGEMSVWLARKDAAAIPVNSPPVSVKVNAEISSGKNITALNDGIYPKRRGEDKSYFYWTLTDDSTGWTQYNFRDKKEISAAKVYWVNNISGEIRLPESWKILYKSNGNWTRVYSEDDYRVTGDKFDLIEFETVRSDSFRLEIQFDNNYSAGIYEWELE